MFLFFCIFNFNVSEKLNLKMCTRNKFMYVERKKSAVRERDSIYV